MRSYRHQETQFRLKKTDGYPYRCCPARHATQPTSVTRTLTHADAEKDFFSRSILRTVWTALSAVSVGMLPPPTRSTSLGSRRKTLIEVPPDVVSLNVSAALSCNLPPTIKAASGPLDNFGSIPSSVKLSDCVETETTSR